MSSAYSLSLPPQMYLSFSVRCSFRHADVTCAARRHHRRRLLKYSPDHPQSFSNPPAIFKLSDDTLQITLKSPSGIIQKLESKLNQVISLGRVAFDDLKTVVSVDGDTGRVVISCRRSSIEFLTVLLISSFILVAAVRSLFKVRKFGGGEEVIYRRDRSLGGREVVVAKRESGPSTSRTSTPLSSESANYNYQKKNTRTNSSTRRRKEELPRWWPQLLNQGPLEIENKEEYQKLANQLIQVIMDRKMSGEDISTKDIVQRGFGSLFNSGYSVMLRYICKTYGVKAFISTANTRDSLYRVAVNFVLDYCESIPDISTSIEINGEDVREFIAGLSDNIGLERYRAARIISAAVAARTRSKILQAWALEVQNKHSEGLVELFKVCLIHRIFPPEENSPEMEMVARSLDKSLNIDQREHILNSFITVCGQDINQPLVEALGLVEVKDEQENQHV